MKKVHFNLSNHLNFPFKNLFLSVIMPLFFIKMTCFIINIKFSHIFCFIWFYHGNEKPSCDYHGLIRQTIQKWKILLHSTYSHCNSQYYISKLYILCLIPIRRFFLSFWISKHLQYLSRVLQIRMLSFKLMKTVL